MALTIRPKSSGETAASIRARQGTLAMPRGSLRTKRKLANQVGSPDGGETAEMSSGYSRLSARDGDIVPTQCPQWALSGTRLTNTARGCVKTLAGVTGGVAQLLDVKLCAVRNLPVTEFSSAPVSQMPDARPCCCVPVPPARIFQGSRRSWHVPPMRSGNCATSRH